MNIALVPIVLATVLALVLGIVARARQQMNLEQWTVGGRRFGAGLVFVLLAGEIYTTFTLLGASGFAYGLGAPERLQFGTRCSPHDQCGGRQSEVTSNQNFAPEPRRRSSSGSPSSGRSVGTCCSRP
jgi:hypothetical protein